jgi:CRP/FNR family transcriptional regulator
MAEPAPLARGTVLFRQGDAAMGVYLLTRGTAKLFLTSDSGEKLTLRTAGPGNLLGLSAAISGNAHLLTAELIEDADISFIPTSEALDFLRKRSDLCFNVVQMLGDELLQLPPVVNRPATRRRRNRSN